MPLLQIQESLWPFAVYFFAALTVVGGMLGLSYVLGERGKGIARDQPYESGILPTGTARLRFNAKFYLIALDFVIFDVEVMFIVAWAIALRDAGWTGYLAMLAFVGVLLASLAYIWRSGGLDWGPRQRVPPEMQQRG